MRLCTVAIEPAGSFFALDLGKGKLLRISAAARALNIREAPLLADMHSYLANLPKSEKALRALLQKVAEAPKALPRTFEGDGMPFTFAHADVRWMPPIPRPGKFLCIGLNYRDHCVEQNVEPPKTPMVFNKFGTSLRAHGDVVALPLKRDEAADFEGELGVVIGKTARNVTRRAALKHVAGYTVVNDLTLRTLQGQEKQWARAKGFDGSAPFGPVVVTADEIPDPQKLAIRTRLNGRLLQNGTTENMVFGVAHLIAFISELLTLEPGDVIATGTPAGVGKWQKPPVYLRDGDRIEIEIERIGTLANSFVAEP
jgi:acylpyruvate hydrolase